MLGWYSWYDWYASYVDSVSQHISIPAPKPGSMKMGPYQVYYLYSYGEIRDLVHRWKFGPDGALGFRLGQALGTHYKQLLEKKLVSYVPTFGELYPFRGNHLFSLLAGVRSSVECNFVRAYAKTRHTLPQKSLSRTARRKNLDGAFAGLGRAELLIDDVVTTGVTGQTLYQLSRFDVMLVLARVELDLVFEHQGKML